MKIFFMKISVIFFCMALLGACTSEEPEKSAVSDSQQTKQADEKATTDSTFDQASEEAKEAGEHVSAAAEESVDAASKAATATAEKTGEMVEEARQSTQEMAEQTQETAAEAVDESREALQEAEETAEETVEEGAQETSKAIASVAQPEVLTYEAMNGNVTFDHPMHAEALSCAKCHENMPPQKINIDKTIAHQLCTGCHREMEAGPTACNDCHIK